MFFYVQFSRYSQKLFLSFLSSENTFRQVQNNIQIGPVGLSGLEPPTSRLSGVRSNRLSYKPKALIGLCSFLCSGSHLLSHAVPGIVPSAARVLTIVFGMDTGVSPGRIATRFFVMLKQVRSGRRAGGKIYFSGCPFSGA